MYKDKVETGMCAVSCNVTFDVLCTSNCLWGFCVGLCCYTLL